MKSSCAALFALIVASPMVLGAGSPAPKDATVYFISPADGAKVSSPVTIVFGLRGMGVAPAGTMAANTGHHHLLVNSELKNLGMPIPKDDRHQHFGGGQTEAKIALPRGKHTLQLVLGDAAHTPHQPPVMSDKITIEVR